MKHSDRRRPLKLVAMLMGLLATLSAVAQPEGICGRSLYMRAAIMEALNVDDCAEVGPEALARLDGQAEKQLGTTAKGYAAPDLLPGDFDGLRLRWLGISETPTGAGSNGDQIRTKFPLPAGIFDGLSAGTLELTDYELTVLRTGFLDGLRAETIILSAPQLETIELGAFDEVDGLRRIILRASQLHLQPGQFRGLTLHSLELRGIGRVGDRAFDGLDFVAGSRAYWPQTYVSRPPWLFVHAEQIGSGAFDGVSVGHVVMNSDLIRPGVFRGLTVGVLTPGIGMDGSLPVGAFEDVTFDPSLTTDREYGGSANLFLEGQGDGRLRTLLPGTFRGVIGLERLILKDNELATLPSGVFEGLGDLLELNLSNNELASLPSNVFQGLGNLENLDLSNNELTTLPVFPASTRQEEGDSRRLRINLIGNLIATVPADVFNGVVARDVYLTGNPLTTLSRNAFRGLDTDHLHLYNTSLTTISAGAFNGMTANYSLELNSAPLETIAPGAFRGARLRNLELVHLPLLKRLVPSTFDGLTISGFLVLHDTGLESISSGAFRGIVAAAPHVSRPPAFGIRIWDSQLTAIAANTFAGIDESLTSLSLRRNRLAAMEEGAFHGLFSRDLQTASIDLQGNHLVGLTTDDPRLAGLQDNVDVTIGSQTEAPPVRTGGICGRSEAVVSQILGQLRDDDCSAVDAEALAGLTGRLELTGYLEADDLRGLTNLRVLEWTLGNQASLPAGVFDGLTSLTGLTINASHLRTLPAGVFDGLTNLSSLWLNAASLTDVPPGVFDHLSKLTLLSMEAPRLTQLPAGVFDDLTGLEDFHLEAGLTTLPAGLLPRAAGLTRITTGSSGDLGLRLPRLRSLEVGAFDGLSLSGLRLIRTRLAELPAGALKEQSNLQWLDLSNNRIETLDEGVFDGVTSLYQLDLSNNNIKLVRNGAFAGLTITPDRHYGIAPRIVLSINPMTTIEPGAFADLTVLGDLQLSGNRAETLYPGTFRGLTAGSLVWENGRLKEIMPGAFSGMTFIGTQGQLRLGNNALITIHPGAFSGIRGLTHRLSFFGNALQVLPAGAFAGLNELTNLDLAYNAIDTLDAGTFDGLSNLSSLGLSNNRIRTWPAGTFDLPRLQSLNLSHNLIENMTWDMFIGLGGLDRLALDYNLLSELPGGVFDRLVTLERLGLGGNWLYNPGWEDAAFRGLGSLNTYRTSLSLGGQWPFYSPPPTTLNRAAVSYMPSSEVNERGWVGQSVVALLNRTGRDVRYRNVLVGEANSALRPELRCSGRCAEDGAWGRLPPSRYPVIFTRSGGPQVDWIDVEMDADLRVVSYANWTHAEDGKAYATPMHDVLHREGGKLQVPIFYPASDRTVTSSLRLINTGAEPAALSITGTDDAGMVAGPVTLRLAAGALRNLSAADLERGAGGLEGRLGSGAGLWRLAVTAGEGIVGMNLLETPSGEVSNLSTSAQGASIVPLLESGVEDRRGFVRIINESDESGTVRLWAYDDSGNRAGSVALRLGPQQATSLTVEDLEGGNAAKGIEGVGQPTQGHWRLQVETELAVQTLAYSRASGGMVTSMHDVVRRDAQGALEAPVLFWWRAADLPKLRLINTGMEAATVSIGPVSGYVGTNRDGQYIEDYAHSPVSWPLGPGASRSLSWNDLREERFVCDAANRNTVGGCWARLHLTAPRTVVAMHLEEVADLGALVNRSTSGTDIRIGGDDGPQGVNVCGRTPQVRAAIMEQAGAGGCGGVTLDFASLDLSNKGLTALRSEDLAGLSELQTLSLGGNALRTLPDDAFEDLSQLRELDLRGNEFETLPNGAIDDLANLQTLDLSGNNLATLPDAAFDGLSRLQALHLIGNRLTSLPQGAFEGLAALEELNLRGNGLTTLPDAVFDGLPWLRALNLRDNELAALPAGVFDSLTRLVNLNLRGNRLVTLPGTAFHRLAGLRRLSLDENGLTSLPAGAFDGLALLDELFLRNNNLASLPAGVFDGLTSLQSLNLRRNRLTALPEGVFDRLAGLETLDLGVNSLRRLPEGVLDGAASLVHVRADHNQLASLPAGLFDGLARLLSLSLKNNRLAALPEALFAGLSNLRRVDLRNNHLVGLTREAPLFGELHDVPRLEGQAEVGRRRLTAAVPLLVSASSLGRQGFVRVINESDAQTQVRVLAFDDAGRAADAVEFSLDANHAIHFNAGDLENGNADKGINTGIGPPSQGDWRLDVEAGYGVRVLSYVRTEDGFLTSMHDKLLQRLTRSPEALMFNPASNTERVSKLRLLNTGARSQRFRIWGTDDLGLGYGPVELTLSAGESRTLSAFDLEEGARGLTGSLGDGEGKWKLSISSCSTRGGSRQCDYGARPSFTAMSLLDSASGHLSNLSSPSSGYSAPRPALWNNSAYGDGMSHATVPLLLSPSNAGRQSFVRVIGCNNRGFGYSHVFADYIVKRCDAVRIRAADDSGNTKSIWLEPAEGKAYHFNSADLENGNANKGINTGIGRPVQGDWRLDAMPSSAEVVELNAMLAYVRTDDGFLSVMHDTLPREDQGRGRLVAWMFNPASNIERESKLRLSNVGVSPADVGIEGVDDRGNAAGPVTLTLAGGESRTLSARNLEEGAAGLAGSLGDGEGKWRLYITAPASVEGMSLLDSASGHLSNLSTPGASGEDEEPYREAIERWNR